MLPEYWEHPTKKTLLTEVAFARASEVALARSIYYASRPDYAHKAPTDRGHMLAEGHKLKIDRVRWQDGALLHRVTGPPPAKGAKVQAHLDWPRRHETMRAHAVMHLLFAAVPAVGRGTVVSAEVAGGGRVKATLRLRDASPAALARLVATLNGWIGERLDVVPEFAPRDATERVATPQHVPLSAIAPAEPSLRLVRIGERSVLPCDGPHVANTRELGGVAIENALRRGEETRVLLKVL